MRAAVWILAAVGVASCGRQGGDTTNRDAAAPRQVTLPGQAPASKLPDLVPRPADKAQLDRLILAGYTPHDDHMHAPGANECPINKGTEAVM